MDGRDGGQRPGPESVRRAGERVQAEFAVSPEGAAIGPGMGLCQPERESDIHSELDAVDSYDYLRMSSFSQSVAIGKRCRRCRHGVARPCSPVHLNSLTKSRPLREELANLSNLLVCGHELAKLEVKSDFVKVIQVNQFVSAPKMPACACGRCVSPCGGPGKPPSVLGV